MGLFISRLIMEKKLNGKLELEQRQENRKGNRFYLEVKVDVRRSSVENERDRIENLRRIRSKRNKKIEEIIETEHDQDSE